MSANSPIADLSYRNITDGARRRGGSWWVIARTHIQRMMKLRSYWVLMVISGVFYLITAAVTYFIDSFTANMGDASFAEQFFERMVWKDQFLSGFQWGHFLLMAILLLVGAGSIANDNRSKALLVYFSKPCSKMDYLIGKFLGIFILLAIAILIPAVFFMAYGGMNFREHGFFSDDPMMIPKVLLAIILVSAYQSSIVLGVSSMFNQGRLAGATYAGFYVLSGVFAGLAGLIAQGNGAAEKMQTMLDRIHYLSLYGGSEGIYKAVLGTDGSVAFGQGRGNSEGMLTPRPEGWLLLLITVVPVVVSWAIAIKKVRAVEVVS